jgi:hypothetical protein
MSLHTRGTTQGPRSVTCQVGFGLHYERLFGTMEHGRKDNKGLTPLLQQSILLRFAVNDSAKRETLKPILRIAEESAKRN